ncbi:SpoIID/LytB domain-containing protein [Fictibacillus nanhaiensis]|uniref:SpoIID/LytB domain-containing protein n=1 Tax=Fictibacillus nanhaiensis TaxID=742169 RepID=A0ABS2ZNW0_9BACL|nr:SpoIID/LytB domain-containing protein [Fictibacillus nanhaiensis]
MKKYLVSLLVVTLVLSSIFISKQKEAYAADPVVSVSLNMYIQNATALSFLPKGTYKVTEGGKTLGSGKKYTVKVVKGELYLYNGSILVTKGRTLTVKPNVVASTHLLTLYGKKTLSYMGTMKFTVEGSKYIRPINSLPIEEYIKGVVPGEMDSSYHLQALKSQAIIARSYVMYKVSAKKNINDTPSYQHYTGYNKENNKTDKAIMETKGKVLTYQGKVVETLYNASNGGYTETNRGAWPGVGAPKLPYFIAKPDSYDSKKLWTKTFSRKQISLAGKNVKKPDSWWGSVVEKDKALSNVLKEKLTASNQTSKIVEISSVALPKERTEGKRLLQVAFYVTYFMKDASGMVIKNTKGEAKLYGKKVTISADQFKSALGLTSKYVTGLSKTSTHFKVSGLGNGHGVGLSQIGANARAKGGLGYREVLAFYYPNTSLKNDKTSSIPSALQVTGKVNYEGVNIRKSPTTSSASLGKGKLGQAVTVLGKTKEWYKIKIGSLTGYMHEDYVTVNQQLAYKNGITPISSGRIQYLGSNLVIEKNTVYVPLVGLSKRYAMTSKVSGSTISITSGSRKVTASLVSNTATVNGVKKTLSVRPKMIYKAVYVPASFLSETGLAYYYEEKAEGVLWINR